MDLLGAYGSEDEEEPKQTEPSPAILNQSNPQPAQPPARKKIKIVVKEESASLSDDEISPVNSTNGTGGLFSRLPKPVHASTKAAKIIPIAVKKKAVVEKKIEESFFTIGINNRFKLIEIATRKESDEIIQPTHIGPRNVSKSASSAYSSTYAVNTYNEPTNPAQERIDSSMGLIPTQEKKRMADNFTIVDIKQDDVIGSWESDRLKSMSQTQRYFYFPNCQ
jgi:hypothetical protein